MHIIRATLLVLPAFVATWLGAAGDKIAWEKKEIDVYIDRGANESQFAFKYRNIGDQPVIVTNTDSGCDCSKAEAVPAEVAPGEGGTVRVKMNVRGRTGVTTQAVRFETINGIYSLRVNVHVREWYAFDRTSVTVEDEGQDATCAIAISADQGEIKRIEILTMSESLKSSVVEVKPGFKYNLLTTPKALAAGAIATVTVRIWRTDDTFSDSLLSFRKPVRS